MANTIVTLFLSTIVGLHSLLQHYLYAMTLNSIYFSQYLVCIIVDLYFLFICQIIVFFKHPFSLVTLKNVQVRSVQCRILYFFIVFFLAYDLPISLHPKTFTCCFFIFFLIFSQIM